MTHDWELGSELKAVVDCRCFCDRCEAGNSGMFRMVGYCLNCGTKPILFLFRAGDKARPDGRTCPACGYRGYGDGLKTVRMATADEIPAAVVTP